MLISQATPKPGTPTVQKPSDATPSQANEQAPVERFDRASEALMTIYARNPEAAKSGATIAKGIGGAALGGALGVYAGIGTGWAAGLAGAATLALPGALAGAVGAGVLAEKYGTSGSETAGAAIFGGVIGGVASLAGGFYLGWNATGSLATVGLGIAGAAAGAYFATN